VSQNTLKTRVRQLLHILQHDTLDALGKTLLRRAIDLVPVPDPLHGAPPQASPRPVAGLLPTERRSSVPAASKSAHDSMVVPSLGVPSDDRSKAG
jgi:hypothetical protein